MRRLSRLIGALLLVSGLLTLTHSVQALEPLMTHIGLGCILHPIQKPELLPFPTLTKDEPVTLCTDHVYIFAINGVDPLCKGNFNGLCKYLKEQGFHNTYFGQLYTSHGFAGRIREIRQQDPQARIVLIGFSLGTNYAKCIANILCKEGIGIDLVVYLSGDYLTNSPRTFPPNVGKVLNVTAHGLWVTGCDLFFNGVDIDRARNCRLKSRHIAVPSRRQTVTMIMEELMALACSPPAHP